MTIHTHTLQGGDPIDTFLHQPTVVIAKLESYILLK